VGGGRGGGRGRGRGEEGLSSVGSLLLSACLMIVKRLW
jgi:hypothetical protein